MSKDQKKELSDFKKKFIENFKKQRESGKGAGGIFETFFSTAEPEFIEFYERKVADYAVIGKELVEQARAAENDEKLKSKLLKAFSDIAEAQRAVRSKEEED